eukprot:TRINITY_DN14503_c0_g3_i1.p3 TRINITY_DN14503_c0_g3~~TRINITY_DN14503_c0_g3_i1.p3  ORF type:complete len:168 (-),score=20.00 TRINITY_DN14503_c0_g3_i1:351-854(-)
MRLQLHGLGAALRVQRSAPDQQLPLPRLCRGEPPAQGEAADAAPAEMGDLDRAGNVVVVCVEGLFWNAPNVRPVICGDRDAAGAPLDGCGGGGGAAPADAVRVAPTEQFAVAAPREGYAVVCVDGGDVDQGVGEAQPVTRDSVADPELPVAVLAAALYWATPRTLWS